eukprot:COSAG03_NODE_8459_length_798_cov_0.782051_1_plen_147_part_00
MIHRRPYHHIVAAITEEQRVRGGGGRGERGRGGGERERERERDRERERERERDLVVAAAHRNHTRDCRACGVGSKNLRRQNPTGMEPNNGARAAGAGRADTLYGAGCVTSLSLTLSLCLPLCVSHGLGLTVSLTLSRARLFGQRLR